jgi:(4S)-4-hydroxy-5-phosphonooxypentane-2,3-dione isomerase
MMYIVLVHIHIKPEFVSAFIQASLDNANNSILEPGITRFDLIQEQDDPTRFILIEAYRTLEDSAAHKDTAHYARWRDQVSEILMEPRKGVRYINLNSDEYWA